MHAILSNSHHSHHSSWMAGRTCPSAWVPWPTWNWNTSIFHMKPPLLIEPTSIISPGMSRYATTFTTWDLATLLLHVEWQNSINFAAEAAKLDNQMLPSRKQHKDVADGFHSIRNSFARLNLKETSSTSAGWTTSKQQLPFYQALIHI